MFQVETQRTDFANTNSYQLPQSRVCRVVRPNLDGYNANVTRDIAYIVPKKTIISRKMTFQVNHSGNGSAETVSLE